MPFKREYKPLLGFEYACYICHKLSSTPKAAINHVYNIHGYELPARSVGHKRPPDPKYEYIYQPSNQLDAQHYACTSCWFHCPKDAFEELTEHVLTVHQPLNVEPTRNDKHDMVEAEEIENNELETTEEDEDYTMEVEDYETIDGQKLEPIQAINASDILGKLTEISDMFKDMFQ